MSAAPKAGSSASQAVHPKWLTHTTWTLLTRVSVPVCNLEMMPPSWFAYKSRRKSSEKIIVSLKQDAWDVQQIGLENLQGKKKMPTWQWVLSMQGLPAVHLQWNEKESCKKGKKKAMCKTFDIQLWLYFPPPPNYRGQKFEPQHVTLHGQTGRFPTQKEKKIKNPGELRRVLAQYPWCLTGTTFKWPKYHWLW